MSSRIRSHFCLSFVFLIALAGCASAADVLTGRNDNARTGTNPAETILTPQNVNANTFGRLFNLLVDGQVYAQPLYKSQVSIPGQGVHDVVIVATEHDSVYAFDANGNNPAQGYLWKVSFINPSSGLTPVLPTDVNTVDITPEIGITGTPVIDPSTNTIYVVSKAKQTSASGTQFIQMLHALDLTTGAEKMNGPVLIQAAANGTGVGSANGVVNFNSQVENQRAALALVNGVVYIAWAAHGDQGPYHGWVMGYQASNVQQQVAAWCDTPDAWGGGIWMSGGGISVDSSANLFVVSGNGGFNNTLTTLSDSAIRLSTTSGLTPVDYFTPDNQDQLTQFDADMGTSNAIVLPDQSGPFAHLLITANKQGTLYLIDRDSMGGYNATYNADVQQATAAGTIHNELAYFNNTIYVGPDGSSLQGYSFLNGVMSQNPVMKSTNTFGQNFANASGTSPTISASGATNGIVWALNNYAGPNSPAVLYAYNASNLATLYNSTQATNNRDAAGNAVKFTTPTIADGKVFVPGVNTVTVYGLLSSGLAKITADPTFSSPDGTLFQQAQSITIDDTTPGAVIYYTTDGTTPSSASAVYSGPIQITGPTKVNAVAVAPGYAASQVASAFFTVLSSDVPATPSFSAGFTSAGLVLNSSATVNANRLRLTNTNGTYQAGTAFYVIPVNIQQFTTSFQLQLTNAQADGLTFTIQNQGPTALGSTGGGLGYGPQPGYSISFGERNISKSVAVKFDIYDNAGEGTSSTGLFTNGATPDEPGSVDMLASGINLSSGDVFQVNITYDGTILHLNVQDTKTGATFSTQFQIDIPATVGGNTAYVGFTGGTGGLSAIQDVLQWNFTSAAISSYSVSGQPQTVRRADFDGDGKADIVVWRPLTGVWYVVPSSTGIGTALEWGVPGDVPVAGDFDGDKKTDYAVWRPSNGTWYILPSTNPSAAYAIGWGVTGDTPVAFDYDGDGKTDIGVWRPSNGTWYILPSTNPQQPVVLGWGLQGDMPVLADFDGDGKTDIGVWRPSNGTWYILPSSNPQQPIVRGWGLPGDVPVPGYFNAKNVADFAIWRPSDGTWYILHPDGSYSSQPWGQSGDVPVVDDYDHDNNSDLTVWRPSTGAWYILPSSQPTAGIMIGFGASGDVTFGGQPSN